MFENNQYSVANKHSSCRVCTGHPDQVDAVVAFDQDTIITGCNDGMIRVLALQPNQFLHVLGSHPDGLGVEALALGPGHHLLASVSQDEHAYVWSLNALHDSSDEVRGFSSGLEGVGTRPWQEDEVRRKQPSTHTRGRHRIRGEKEQKKPGNNNFFAGLL